MTEQEWLASASIEALLSCLVDKKYPESEPCNWGQGERKKRLFLCASLKRIWPQLPDEYRKAFEMLEPEADAQVSAQKRTAVWSAAEALQCEHGDLLFAVGYDDIGLLCFHAARIAEEAGPVASEQTHRLQPQEQRAQASLLRDIFGNPFRPVGLDPAWATWNDGAIRKIALAIYDERAFDRLPLLADALEDAGCTNAEILAHCRRPGPHVRGCWVVDLLLGKK